MNCKQFFNITWCSLLLLASCRDNKSPASRGLHTEPYKQPKAALSNVIPFRDVVPPIVALVIWTQGNDIKNPERDAELIATRLREMSIIPLIVSNADTTQMVTAISDFRNRLGELKDALGIVYFAGHGFVYAGETWLASSAWSGGSSKIPSRQIRIDESRNAKKKIPSGFSQSSDKLLNQVVTGALPLSAITKPLESTPKLGLWVFLDCCRTEMQNDGLVPANYPCPRNTKIIYSTLSGEEASDGPKNGHTAFASTLADLLSLDLTSNELLQDLQTTVDLKTQSAQTVQITGSYIGSFRLRPSLKAASVIKLVSSTRTQSTKSSSLDYSSDDTKMEDSYERYVKDKDAYLKLLFAKTKYCNSARNLKSMIFGIIQLRLGLDPRRNFLIEETQSRISVLQRNKGWEQNGLFDNEVLNELGILQMTVGEIRNEASAIKDDW